MSHMLTHETMLENIHFRDPFIWFESDEAIYYLYGSIGHHVWSGPAIGFDVYRSKDLKLWEGPIAAFRPGPDFWSDRQFWAPEVFKYGGRYYMFASFKAESVCRTTGVLVAEHPAGPFAPLSFSLNPKDWQCLDGTLYLDGEGRPWMVFCREWVQVRDGEMYAVRLNEELTGPVGDPVFLFRASEAEWSAGFGDHGDQYITDGPYLHRMKSGELLMLWTTSGMSGYTMGTARSLSGEISGPWVQDPEPLFDRDGGHGMLFRGPDGELLLTIHAPNEHPQERPVIIPVAEEDGRLVLKACGPN